MFAQFDNKTGSAVIRTNLFSRIKRGLWAVCDLRFSPSTMGNASDTIFKIFNLTQSDAAGARVLNGVLHRIINALLICTCASSEDDQDPENG